MSICLEARLTLTALEMDRGEVIHFRLRDGSIRTLELLETSARVLFTTLSKERIEQRGDSVVLPWSRGTFALRLRPLGFSWSARTP